MKYTVEITIDLPRKRVVELFNNPDNMPKWMNGLESFEHISGEPGQPGAKSRLVFNEGKRVIEMVETIHTNNLPEEMTGSYETNGVVNNMVVQFKELDENSTKYIAYQEFIFSGLFMKLMGLLMPGAFKKQSMKYMESFKKFAEAEG